MIRQLRTLVAPWTEGAGWARLLREEQKVGRDAARGDSSFDAPVLIDDVSVVELSDGLAAPYAARLLGDLGADVLKIETPAGDPTRRREPFWPSEQGREAGALFAYLDAGKRRAMLDFDAPSDIEKLHLSLNDAAILVENQPVPRLQALGIDGPSLHEQHPHLVVLSITPFGRNGPLTESPATDFTRRLRVRHGAAGGRSSGARAACRRRPGGTTGRRCDWCDGSNVGTAGRPSGRQSATYRPRELRFLCSACF